MKERMILVKASLEEHTKRITKINSSEVITMLRVMQAADKIQHAIIDVLERYHQLSEGKLRVMILLHKENKGIAPSTLAYQTGVSRATISVMIRRMTRDGLVYSGSDDEDGRAKKIYLTDFGQKLIDDILPQHYVRITNLMQKISEKEQEKLIFLLQKIVSS